MIGGNVVTVAMAHCDRHAAWKPDKNEFNIWVVAISLVGAGQSEHDGGVDGLLSMPERSEDNCSGQRWRRTEPRHGAGPNWHGGAREAAIGLMITLRTPTKA